MVHSLPLNTVPAPVSGLGVSVISIATNEIDMAWEVVIDDENNDTGLS